MTPRPTPLLALVALVLAAPGLSTAARNESRANIDEDALQQLPKRFADAWLKHDGHALAGIMADDVDFVTVGATWLNGRRDFETYHTRLLNGRFKNATLTPLETVVTFHRPDFAIVRWSWSIEGDRNSDGTERAKRHGLMTMVAEKRGTDWLVIAAQNTNSGLLVPPEAEGIRHPIVVPRMPAGSPR